MKTKLKKFIVLFIVMFALNLNAQTPGSYPGQYMGIPGCFNLEIRNHRDGKWITYTTTNNATNGFRRGFYVRNNKQSHLSTKKPVVIFNHGDELPIDFIDILFTNWEQKAFDNGFIIILPQGGYKSLDQNPSSNNVAIKSADIAAPTMLNTSKSGITFFPQNVNVNQQHYLQEIQHFHVIIQLLKKGILNTNLYNEDKIYMAGYSGGAMITQIAATKLNDKIAAFASVAGGKPKVIPNNFRPNFKVPMMLINGTADTNVSFLNDGAYFVNHSTTRSFWAQVNGLNIQPVGETSYTHTTFPINNNVTATKWGFRKLNSNTIVDYYKTVTVFGGGHHWPLGPNTFAIDPDLPTLTACFKINATNMIWDFFQNKQKSQNGTAPASPASFHPVVVPRMSDTDIISETEENSNKVVTYNSYDNNQLNIDLYDFNPSNYNLSIFNINNSAVSKQSVNVDNNLVSSHKIDISHLPKGIYFLKITEDDKIIKVVKFVK